MNVDAVQGGRERLGSVGTGVLSAPHTEEGALVTPWRVGQYD